MLIRVGNHALHLLMDALIGVVGLCAVLALIFAWRLAQGPIDITWLVQREQASLAPPGMNIAVGGAALAWEGFVARDQPLDIRLKDVRIAAAADHFQAQVPQANVALAIGQLLLGRIVPRSIAIDGVTAQAQLAPARPASGDSLASVLRVLTGQGGVGEPPWLRQLHRVDVQNSKLSLRDPASGLVWQVRERLVFDRRRGGGVAGQAQIDVAVGSLQAHLAVHAEPGAGGTHVVATATPVSPAALAALTPAFAALAAVDVPIAGRLETNVGADLVPRSTRLLLSAGAGIIKAGRGQVGLQSADIVVLARPSELLLNSGRIAFAALPGKQAPPVLNASATATLLAGRVHATFALGIPALQMADLGDYLPPGTGGGSRNWLVENILGGHAHDAHVEGAIDAASDLSNPQLTALSGGLSADDVSVVWLKPIPPITHGRARLAIEGPDHLHIAFDAGDQDRLRLAAGSGMEITGLQEKHQFGDIDVRIAGPLDTALTLLNHPRLNLLGRGGLDFSGASGAAQARMLVHLPLEDTVTMDDIHISATAKLADVHLGKIAADRDLDHAQIALKVDNNGLSAAGAGAYAGIPADLTLTMDFRDGASNAVLQHVTAHGTATAAEVAAAGVPETVTKSFGLGSTALGVDYAARRDRTATLLLDADLLAAQLQTPLGWNKAPGIAASAGARLNFAGGKLVGIDHLHAEGPGLLIASHARIEAEHTHALVLDKLEIGHTRAHGEITFPTAPTEKLRVQFAGPMLDISTYLDQPAAERAKAVPAREDSAPVKPEQGSEPWAADLNFAAVTLAKGKILAPFKLTAATDGVHITQAAFTAGPPGAFEGRIAPGAGTRSIAVQSSDAGVFLRAIGVADNLDGGHLQLDGVFQDDKAGDPLTGTATLDNFDLRQAPAIGRLLQGMTLYGVLDLLRGPGLHFAKLVAPFRWQRRVLTLNSARAFSPSLGVTAAGDIDLRRRIANVKGTVVPAYFFNQLLGDLPIVGRIFSPEKGGGVFAARYSVTGPLSDPKVGVNPLSALTPGFLREVFGLLSPREGK